MALREFSSVKVGDELPEKTIPLTRADLVNYAGVSATSTRFTGTTRSPKQVGLDTAIAHGMLTLGLGGGYGHLLGGRSGRRHRVQRALHRGRPRPERRQGR